MCAFALRSSLSNVIRIGFEPMTPSLEGLCSIQLSYRTCSQFAFVSLQKARKAMKKYGKGPETQTSYCSKCLVDTGRPTPDVNPFSFNFSANVDTSGFTSYLKFPQKLKLKKATRRRYACCWLFSVE
jgi:hypothetical protein